MKVRIIPIKNIQAPTAEIARLFGGQALGRPEFPESASWRIEGRQIRAPDQKNLN